VEGAALVGTKRVNVVVKDEFWGCREIGLGLRGGVVGVRGFLGGVEGARCRFSYRGRGSWPEVLGQARSKLQHGGSKNK